MLARILNTEAFATYLLPSTSAAIIGALHAAHLAELRCRPVGPLDQHYPPALRLFSDVAITGNGSASFRTHVSPLTGAVDQLDGDETKIVDGAQSLGTCLNEQLLQRADVVLAPLHKHLGIALGLAIGLVRLRSTITESFDAVLSVMEDGAQSYELLERAIASASSMANKPLNVATLHVDDVLRNTCDKHGFAVLGTSGPPFICVSPLDGGAVEARLRPGRWRHLKEVNGARFAYVHRAAFGDEPVDFTSTFVEDLRRSVF